MSIRDSWSTPPRLARLLIQEFGCTLDVCADATNHKCDDWFGPGSPLVEDALAQGWGMDYPVRTVCWCNPPYSDITPWVKHAIWQTRYNVETIMLVPCDPSVAWWAYAMPHVAEVRLLVGRVQFVPPAGVKASSNPKPSAVLRFLPHWRGPQWVDTAWDWKAALTYTPRQQELEGVAHGEA